VRQGEQPKDELLDRHGEHLSFPAEGITRLS
jgi:hypothetical protein